MVESAKPIVYLAPGQPPPSPFMNAFLQGLAACNRGANDVDFRYAKSDPDLFAANVENLTDVQVIVAPSTPAALAAAARTTQTAIVMVCEGDPVGTGLVSNLQHPGGNITGVTSFSTDLSRDRLREFKKALPDIARVAVVGNLTNPAKGNDLLETVRAARSVGVSIGPVIDVSDPPQFRSQLEAAYQEAADDGANGVLLLADSLMSIKRDDVVRIANAHEPALRTMYQSSEFVNQAGGARGLIAFGPDRPALYALAAEYACRILNGDRAGDLRIESVAPQVFTR